MDKEDFFTGKTEKYVIQLLKERGNISVAEIESFYSGLGRELVIKLLSHELVKRIDKDFLAWVGEKKE